MQTKLYFKDRTEMYMLYAVVGKATVGYIDYSNAHVYVVYASCIFDTDKYCTGTIQQAKNWIARRVAAFFRDCEFIHDPHTLKDLIKTNPKYWGRRGKTLHIPNCEVIQGSGSFDKIWRKFELQRNDR